jgi:hypothetical protein
MNRPDAILGPAVFLVIAPGTLAVLMPYWICRWHMSPPLLGWGVVRVIGVLLIAAGLPLLLDSFARFAI